MRCASCLIALMFLSTSLTAMVPTGTATSAPVQGPPASRAAAGPFGPSDLVKLFDSGPISGDLYYPTTLDDLDGDGGLDLLYVYIGNGGSTTTVSAINLKTHKYLWTNNWTAPAPDTWYKVVDLNGDGKKELIWVTQNNVYVLHANDGTLSWSKPISGSGGCIIGDTNGDKRLEVIIGNGADVQYRSYNGTTGALQWTSGLLGFTYNPQVGELDNDGHQELVIQYTSMPDSGLYVLDAVSNTTEWSKTFSMGIEVLVGDFNSSGKDAVLVRVNGAPVNLTLFGKGGTAVWSNENYQSPAYIYQLFNTDNDKNMEILSSDSFSGGMELIDAVSGKAQGYAYCSTYPPTWTVPIESGPTNSSDIASTGWSGSDYGLTFYNGNDMSFIYNYTFSSEPIALKHDVDGDSKAELVVRTLGDSMSVYDYSTHSLKWKNASLGPGNQLANGWITAGLNNTVKVMDLITGSMVGGGPTSRLVFFDGASGTTVESTSTYENPFMIVNDTDNDGIDELLLFTDAYGTSTSHIYLLKDDFPPRVKTKIPTIQMVEDTNLTHALDLSMIFLDDGMNGPLTYTVVPGTGTPPVVGSLSGTWLDLKAKIKDWNGFTYVNVTASDSKHPATVATVHIHMAPVNDEPTIDHVNDQTFFERSHASFRVVGHDVDGDKLFYTDNTSMFTIDIDTGWANFTPTEADVGIHHVNVTVTDTGDLMAFAHFKVTIVDVNDPPVITTIDVVTAKEGVLYGVQYNATDPDKVDTVLTWSLWTTTKFLHIDTATGILSGTPTVNDIGPFPVNVTVTDPRSDFAFHNFTLLVTGIEHPPVWKNVPKDTTIYDTDQYSFTVNATDVDKGDKVTYGVKSIPTSGISMDPATGHLSWSPLPGTVGNFSINITATDGRMTIFYVFKIQVIYNITITDNPPTATLVSPADHATVDALNPVLTWTVTDTDGDPVTSNIYYGTDWGLVQAQDPSTIKASGLTALSYKPTTPLEGGKTYYWTVIPFDGKVTGTCTNLVWSFKVAQGAIVNHPPVLSPISKREVTAGQTFKQKVNGSDEDTGDVVKLVFGLFSPPKGMGIDPSTGLITWVTNASQVGNYTIKVTLSDGKETVDMTFPLEVKKAIVTPPPNHKPNNNGNGYLFAAIGGVVVAVVAIILGILLWTRTKRKGPEMTSVPSEKASVGSKAEGTAPTPSEVPPKPQEPKPDDMKSKADDEVIDGILADLDEPAAPTKKPDEVSKGEKPPEEPKGEEPLEEPKGEEPLEEPKGEEPPEEPKK